ncbi:MAG TPA: hypothetical protein PKE64_12745 [Anaerolineae bacterium]|nr:hypothetical protein [Anaerolineae bacterium]HMR64868.1 hypothetical protein [Anaerolineae bacterium]
MQLTKEKIKEELAEEVVQVKTKVEVRKEIDLEPPPEREEEPASSESNWLEITVALLIAVTTVIGAVVAWRASVADDASGDADFAGLQAAMNAEETRALNFVNTYENYGAYAAYQRYDTLGDLIEEDLANIEDEQTYAFLDEQRANAHDLALANQELFPNTYLNRDGSYSIQRQLGEMWADAAKEKDLKPEPQFAEADQFRVKTNLLLQSLTVIALALVFFTVVELVKGRVQYLLVALGSLTMVAGTVMAVMIEMGQ